jgi:hypothetical protein
MSILRTVFSEIRQILGDKISTSDAILFADELVQFLARRRIEEGNGYFIKEAYDIGERPFELWPVDEALRDGGWMALEYQLGQEDEDSVGRPSMYGLNSNSAEQLFAALFVASEHDSDRLSRSSSWLRPKRWGYHDNAFIADDRDFINDDFE